MEYIYNTQGTCARKIRVVLDGDIVKKVEFLEGGCPGNLQAVPKLVEGMKISEVAEKLEGIRCGFKSTSCADQLVKALKEAIKK